MQEDLETPYVMVSASIRRPERPLENLHMSLIKNASGTYIFAKGEETTTVQLNSDFDAITAFVLKLAEESRPIYRGFDWDSTDVHLALSAPPRPQVSVVNLQPRLL